MKRKIQIGKGESCQIKLKGKNCPYVHAEILYEKGFWILKNLDESKPIFINTKQVKTSQKLNKYDRINICNQNIYWSNYLHEGDKQELIIKDFKIFNGRISRSNFRVLLLVAFGLSLGIFFMPAFLVSIWNYVDKRGNINSDSIQVMQDVGTYVFVIGYGLLSLFLILISIKRIRDTGEQPWKLLIPIYNLKLLFFDPSKDYSSTEN